MKRPIQRRPSRTSQPFAPLIVSLDYKLGQSVRVKAIGVRARVNGRTDYGSLGVEYRVTYWHHDQRVEQWVRGDELEARA